MAARASLPGILATCVYGRPQAAVSNNDGYQVSEWVPGFIGLGDNGGLEMVGFDTRHGEPYPVVCDSLCPDGVVSRNGYSHGLRGFHRQLLPVE